MTPTTAPPSSPVADGPRRLVRTPDKKIAGVCAGVAHYLGLDPTVVRVVFLISVFAGGIGIVAYGVGWLVMPKGEVREARAVEPADAWTLVAVAALALGLAALFGWTGFAVGGQAFLGALLIGGGIVLLLRRPADARAVPLAVPAIEDDMHQHLAPAAAPAAESPDGREQPEVASARRAPVTAGTLSIGAIVGAALAVGALAGWFEVSTSTVLAILLVIVGSGLVVGSVVPPAPWLFVVGALVTCALVVAAALEPWLDDGLGERTYAPLSAAAIAPRYALGIGDLEVDLRSAQLGEGTRTVEVKLGAGSALVIVPRDIDLELRSHVGAGQIVAPGGRSADGFDERLDASYEGGSAGRLVLVLDVDAGYGEVRRGS